MQGLAIQVWVKAEGCGKEARRAGCSRGLGCHCSHPYQWQSQQQALDAATDPHQLSVKLAETLDSPEYV